jgi:hypothetical protein
MADFAVWVTAAEPALQLAPGTFLRSYQKNRTGAHLALLDASPLARAIEDLLGKHNGRWIGTPTELHRDLSIFLDETGKRGFPKSAKALTDAVRRLAPNLRTVGIEAAHDRTAKRRLWIIEKRGEAASDASRPSTEPVNGRETLRQQMTHEMTIKPSVTNGNSQVTLEDKTGELCVTPQTLALQPSSVTLSRDDENDARKPAHFASVPMFEEDL